MTTSHPKIFISYSHDDQTHKDWVLTLATRLVANGVDVLLDEWDLTLGSDLPRFMEKGLTSAQRVLAVCTNTYVNKANDSMGGVGYEKMILTAQLMRDIASDRIIPIVRNNTNEIPVPTFLSSKLYVDFRDDLTFEQKYAELLRDIHGVPIKPRPALGPNPFTIIPSPVTPAVSFRPERYVSPPMSGKVTFDYSNNDGCFVLGAGDYAFETQWSAAGESSIYVLRDQPSIRSVALALDVTDISQISDARAYDTSSRARRLNLAKIAVWQNTAGYYLATQVEKISYNRSGDQSNEVTFNYVIAPGKSASFSF